MVKQMEQVQKEEHRTRSELLREAWRQYFERRFAVYTPTKAELQGIRRGRMDIKRGNSVTLEQLKHEVEFANRAPRKKDSRKTTR